MAMDLSSLTDDQRESVRHVAGPLLISAGAGSGKTFTLTQRIAYAFTPESGGGTGEPLVTDIDQICAITFTEKAAQEIKARVKRTLYEQGFREQALKADAAWISTIHGMCSRILRTHALDLGIDPGFDVIGDKQRDEMIYEAIDDVLAESGLLSFADGEEEAPSGHVSDVVGEYAPLFRDYPAQSFASGGGRNQVNVASMVKGLIDKASDVRGGLDSVEFAIDRDCESALARELLLAYEEVACVLEDAGSSKSAEKARDGVKDSCRRLEDFLMRCAGAGEDGDAPMQSLADMFGSLCFVTRQFGSADVKERVGEFQERYWHAAARLALTSAGEVSELLLSLARKVDARFSEAKRAAFVLDNNDLLTLVLDAFEQHPAIAQRYADRFRLVMVDEFQDTSQIQIDLISHIAGENSQRLCTVGDSQQSIYRFRGADVNVYEAHKRSMRDSQVGARYIELAKNFRSHRDILSFVDRIFSRPEAFGDAFMSLVPHEERTSIWRGGPRINLILSSKPNVKEGGLSLSAGDLVAANAAAIADAFARMRERGHRGGEMVVLLRRMNNAEVFAQALRERGFECVVAGGSLFAQSLEAQVIVRLCQALDDEANTAALFDVLTSDLFALCADDLLGLATDLDGAAGGLRRRDLNAGFRASSGFVCDVMEAAREQAREGGLAAAVRGVVLKSGWLARLQDEGAEGVARAANVLKAIRFVDRFEREEHAGVPSVAARVAAELSDGLKEAPGALVANQDETVRILTIHSSKGLQFPIVAVADFDTGAPSFGKLIVEPVGRTVRASLLPGYSLDDRKELSKRSGEYFDQGRKRMKEELASGARANPVPGFAGDAAEQRLALMKRIMREDQAEAFRLLYVALTRASEALVVAVQGVDGKEPEGLTGALCGACFENGFPEHSGEFDFGGTEQGAFVRCTFGGDEDGSGEEDVAGAGAGELDSSGAGEDAESGGTDRLFVVPHLPEAPGFRNAAAPSPRDGLFSYTAIAPHGVRGGADSAVLATSHEDSLGEDAPDPRLARVGDEDRATDLGSAFHRIAQFAAESRMVPSRDRIDALARAYGVSDAQRQRLDAALDHWFSSPGWEMARGAEVVQAEAPFIVPVGDLQMEGQIDLLCIPSAVPGGKAVVFDYKTGGHADEAPERLHFKHLLQAQCYAYAVLLQGFPEVELHFVRVEQGDEVAYRFASSDVLGLEETILSAYASSEHR